MTCGWCLAFPLRRRDARFCKILLATVDLPRFHETGSDLSLVWHNCSLPHSAIHSHTALSRAFTLARHVLAEANSKYLNRFPSRLVWDPTNLLSFPRQKEKKTWIAQLHLSALDPSKHRVMVDGNVSITSSVLSATTQHAPVASSFGIYAYERNKTRLLLLLNTLHRVTGYSDVSFVESFYCPRIYSANPVGRSRKCRAQRRYDSLRE